MRKFCDSPKPRAPVESNTNLVASEKKASIVTPKELMSTVIGDRTMTWTGKRKVEMMNGKTHLMKFI